MSGVVLSEVTASVDGVWIGTVVGARIAVGIVVGADNAVGGVDVMVGDSDGAVVVGCDVGAVDGAVLGCDVGNDGNGVGLAVGAT